MQQEPWPSGAANTRENEVVTMVRGGVGLLPSLPEHAFSHLKKNPMNTDGSVVFKGLTLSLP